MSRVAGQPVARLLGRYTARRPLAVGVCQQPDREVLAVAQLRDAASGTTNPEAGEIAMETTAESRLDIYNIYSRGTPRGDISSFRESTADDDRVPGLALSLSTEKSYDSNLVITVKGTVDGHRLDENDVASLVSNDYRVDGSVDCGTILGISATGLVTDLFGLPAEAGRRDRDGPRDRLRELRSDRYPASIGFFCHVVTRHNHATNTDHFRIWLAAPAIHSPRRPGLHRISGLS